MGGCTSAEANSKTPASAAPRVTITEGVTARGKLSRAIGGPVPVNAFLGIPYAAPPVGKLRFCHPEPIELWKGERDCTKFGKYSMRFYFKK